MRKIGLVVGLLFLVLMVQAQNEDSVFIRRIVDEILTHATAYQNLHTLTKTVGGRLSGSPQMVKAEAWGARAMKAGPWANEKVGCDCPGKFHRQYETTHRARH